ncbi:MAG: hypothetical protein RIM99_03300 [Cyclobacteriaceae bacterium]
MRTLFVVFLVGAVFMANAQQNYEKSAGIRLGTTSGLTFKKFTTEDEAIELILSGRNEGMQFSALYLFHQPMEFSFNENFYVHYGLGGHIGYERFDDISKILVNQAGDAFLFEDKSFFVMGIDASLGIEYRWLEVPITIGFDIKPFFNFIGMRHTRAKFWDSGISFKYVF